MAAEERARVASDLLAAVPAGLRLYSSPLRRCAELAASVTDALGAPFTFDARLAEMHFGDWEMRAWDAIPRAEIDAWAADLADYRPGGGESVQQMAQRVRAFHDELTQSQQDALVICHAGTIKMLQACRPELSLRDMALLATKARQKIGYGELFELDR